jgi:hypothetical protein
MVRASWSGFAVALLVSSGCGSDSSPLPPEWAGALAVNLTQSPACSPVTAPGAQETIEVPAWEPSLSIRYRQAHFRCEQKVCGFVKQDGDLFKALFQPCDMDPTTVAACDCGYQIDTVVPGAVSAGLKALEVYRRWDNRNQPNLPKLVGRVDR